MRADRGPGRLAGWVAVGCACLLCRVAGAEPIPVNVSVQYQHIETELTTREFWSRNLDANYTTRLNPYLLLTSQFRIDAIDFINRPDKRVTPYGFLGLTHTFAGISGSYRPTETTNSSGLLIRQREAQVIGFVSPAGLPRVDLEWTRRRQLEGERVQAQASMTRSGRLTWTRGIFDVRGGIGDIEIGEDGEDSRRTQQENWDAGFGIRTARAQWNLMANYDVGEVKRSGAGELGETNRTQGASLLFNHRLSAVTDWTLNYQFRDATQDFAVGDRTVTTNDGAATVNYRPTRATLLMASFGVRPVTNLSGDNITLGYTMLSATAQGIVRQGWTGVASVAQTLNHQPGNAAYWVGTYRGGSRFILARGLNLDVDATVTANGDTAARDLRTSSQGQVGLSAIPLRRFTFTFNLRGYRSGPNLGTVASRSASRNFDVRWQPMRGMDLGANLAHSSALPKGDPTLTTRQYFARLSPGSRLQMDINYSKSDQTRQDAGAARLPGREVWSGRLLAGLSRRLRASVGGAVADPGTITHSKQFDASLTARLGGGS